MNYTSKWLWFDLKTNFDKICQTQNNSRVGAKSKSCQIKSKINILGVMYYDQISNELYFQMIMIWFQIRDFAQLLNYLLNSHSSQNNCFPGSSLLPQTVHPHSLHLRSGSFLHFLQSCSNSATSSGQPISVTRYLYH